jgi:hypothetical protein
MGKHRSFDDERLDEEKDGNGHYGGHGPPADVFLNIFQNGLSASIKKGRRFRRPRSFLVRDVLGQWDQVPLVAPALGPMTMLPFQLTMSLLKSAMVDTS